ncbi:MAG: tRNA-uridine aminocarboxypropyltransferase [Anaeromyxobacter sp.]
MRELCRRCLRPRAACVCEGLVPAPSRTRVVLLQHPREARVAICSARLARVALENAELHQGVVFAGHARLAEVLAQPDGALLYPGPDAVPATARAGDPPRHLVVIDGTWLQVERMLRDNPQLAALPKLSVVPDGAEGYGLLRREPEAHCMSTIDAVALALGALERDPARFEPMRAAFRRMVAKQLECAQGARRSPRHRPGSRGKAAAGGGGQREPQER